MPKLHLAVIAVIALNLAACGPDGKDESASEEVARGEPVFTGTWEVEGKTIAKESGATHELTGLVILVQEGTDYIATFDLLTALPGRDALLETQVIGSGSAKLDGTTLRGTARLQIIQAMVPGVDARFTLLPRTYSPRLAFTGAAMLDEDGSITIDLDSTGEESEDYPATHTTLTGMPRM